jgi:hypothetical protein
MQEARGSSPLSSTLFREFVRTKVTNASHLARAFWQATRVMSAQEAGLGGRPSPRGSRPRRPGPVTRASDYALGPRWPWPDSTGQAGVADVRYRDALRRRQTNAACRQRKRLGVGSFLVVLTFVLLFETGVTFESHIVVPASLENQSTQSRCAYATSRTTRGLADQYVGV